MPVDSFDFRLSTMNPRQREIYLKLDERRGKTLNQLLDLIGANKPTSHQPMIDIRSQESKRISVKSTLDYMIKRGYARTGPVIPNQPTLYFRTERK